MQHNTPSPVNGQTPPKATMPTPDGETERRLVALEIKASYADDWLDTLNRLVARQQDQIDRLSAEVRQLRQQLSPTDAPTWRSLRDELPPHY